MLKKIPFILIYSRILLAIIIGVMTFLSIENASIYIVSLMILGLLTDVFDGILARKWNVSSEKLRILDSNVDQFFWIVVIASVFYANQVFIIENLAWILAIVILELATYVWSYFKFKKSIATHSLLAKIWTLSLVTFLVDLTLNSSSFIPFFICVVLGIISRLEILFIIIFLKKWTTDVPSIIAVSKLNKGIPIKKNKLFND
ncbi:CDP-alcohol phosphatidyltransferase family protein [Mesonia maritima]|uniref:CDP-diacylglycerol--glycerol-3-phosphate 3-phosphatidyltransferase n=1 Tax=Mesonia maritima TaxID=1793873 RepID=A0ABU1K3Y2_9FLAO|nr:CDP-alcohol phosphatidyltransferase family protein [Mesonia maritima]MDR6300330.1 CDP-diacylglycerol--glycerol-3-phosphate 3-phosphatidyltransferase [Mesonia maritima]